MSNYFNSQLKNRDHIVSVVKDIFYWARTMQKSHSQILDDISRKVYQNPAYNKLSGNNRGFVDGYTRSLWEALKKNLVWCFNLGTLENPIIVNSKLCESHPAWVSWDHYTREVKNHEDQEKINQLAGYYWQNEDHTVGKFYS